MSQPTPYTPTTDFSQQEANNASGRSTVNTAALDAEFANIQSTLDQTLSNIQLIQRDDGKLADLIVDIHTISPDLLNLIGGFQLKGDWSSATAYIVNDLVINGAYTYVCTQSHTSGISFDASYWKKFGFTTGSDAAQAAAAALASQNAAAVSEANALSYKNASQTSANSSASSAIDSANSATAANASASSASASATASANSAALAASNATAAVVGGFKNKIINGGFSVNQRSYVSGAATSAGQYTLDRWKVTGTGGITFSTTNNKTTVTIPAGQTLQQVIEGLNLATGTYVLSWEGTAQGRIAGGSYVASGTVTASITGGANTIIEFNAGTVANVQLEAGSIATPFEHRPYGLELSLCQRYYETGWFDVSGYMQSSSSNIVDQYTYKVTKRIAITPTASGATGSTISNNSLVNGSTNGFAVQLSTNGSGSGNAFYNGSWAAPAEL